MVIGCEGNMQDPVKTVVRFGPYAGHSVAEISRMEGGPDHLHGLLTKTKSERLRAGIIHQLGLRRMPQALRNRLGIGIAGGRA